MVLSVVLGHMNMTQRGFFKRNRKTLPGSLSENQFSLGQRIWPQQSFGHSWRSWLKTTLATTTISSKKINYNHFCNDVCLKLTGNSIPRWINRLGRLGLFCNCVLPPGLNDAKVQQVTAERVREGEKRKIRSQSGRYEASSYPSLSSSSRRSVIKSASQRHCLGSSSSLINACSASSLTVK